jgi:carbamoyl-phosphate synthase small subunit
VVGIAEVDTRAIVRKIRSGKPQRVGISATESSAKKLLERVLASPRTDGVDLVQRVTRKAPEHWTAGLDGREFQNAPTEVASPRWKVVAYDFGMKNNILRSLVSAGFDVHVVPAATPWREALKYEPDGIFYSNGPGDPDRSGTPTPRRSSNGAPSSGSASATSSAADAKTRKMPFGHHGGNQPVMDSTTRQIEITAQNHSFMVDPDTLTRRSPRSPTST